MPSGLPCGLTIGGAAAPGSSSVADAGSGRCKREGVRHSRQMMGSSKYAGIGWSVSCAAGHLTTADAADVAGLDDRPQGVGGEVLPSAVAQSRFANVAAEHDEAVGLPDGLHQIDREDSGSQVFAGHVL